MISRRGLKELFYRTIGMLYKYAEEVTVLDYPPSHTRRSIDLIAKINGKPVLVKVTDDIANLPRTEINELLGASRTIGTSPLIIADSWSGEKLVDFIAYAIYDSYAITPDTLEGLLSGRGKIYVKTAKDGLHVSISGEKLKEARLESGLSLGNVAEHVGVSRKTIYEYERETLEPNIERGKRLLELFGNNILDPINLFQSTRTKSSKETQAHNPCEETVINEIKALGGDAFHLKRSSIDIAARLDERILFVVEHKKTGLEKLYAKLENTGKASKVVESKAFYIYDSTSISKADVEATGLEPIRAKDVPDYIRKEIARKERKD
ncbi:MAG: helix-turn-helix domain-containing protein [Desulfurococcales archaeon]|nr:helix-turn-helix domain-containing protein [Desulfurococcales archaeon]